LVKSPIPIVPPELEERVLFHKYQSCYGSIAYIWIISPVCEFTVARLPTWLAPNLITFTAFSINLIPHFIRFYYYGFDMGDINSPLSTELCFGFGLAYFIYMWLDNCDGKQARKTGNGSPLGMIVDH
jgi:ethanolaminephosphotransferase